MPAVQFLRNQESIGHVLLREIEYRDRPIRGPLAQASVDVVLEADLAAAGRSDRLEDTVDYVRAYALVQEVVEGEPCQLLEAVAERIAGRLLQLERVRRATVSVRKRPPLEGGFRAFGVELTRPS